MARDSYLPLDVCGSMMLRLQRHGAQHAAPLLVGVGRGIQAHRIPDAAHEIHAGVGLLFHGLTPPFDRRGFRVHTIAIVERGKPPDCP
jgi:hypothetical protein